MNMELDTIKRWSETGPSISADLQTLLKGFRQSKTTELPNR